MRPEDAAFEAIVVLARSVSDLQQRAAQAYRPLVDDILHTGSRDAGHIERALDGLLDFCDHDAVLAIYKQLCRYYWPIDPAATACYVNAYRERWDSDEQGGEG